MARRSGRRKPLGNVRRARGRFAARYTHLGIEHTPGRTFTTEELADEWLAAERRLIDRDEWTPPADRRAAKAAQEVRDSTTLATFAHEWIDKRQTVRGTPLAPKTRAEYLRYLDGRLSDLAGKPIASLDRVAIEQWWADNADAPTMRHHAYAFLSSVLEDALDRELIDTNPCRIKHAARRTRQRNPTEVNDLITRLSPLNIATLADHMPDRHQALVLLLAYSGLRPQEAFGLTRSDLIRDTTKEGVPHYQVRITKAVSLGKLGPTKTPESNRIVPLPPHLAVTLDKHLARHAAPGMDGLFFPSSHDGQPYATLGQLSGSYSSSKDGKQTGFNAARSAIGRPQLRPYDLRRWARHTWRLAGISEYECERLLGHKLAAVTGAYHTLDVDALWPALERVSVTAGWSPPPSTIPKPSEAQERVLAGVVEALGDDALADLLTDLPEGQRAAILNQMPPARLARVVGKLAAAHTQARGPEGGAH